MVSTCESCHYLLLRRGGSATRNNQRARSSIAQASLRSAFGNDRRNPCQSEQNQSKPRTSARGDSLAARRARASESGHLKRSFSSPPVASAQTTSRALKPRPPRIHSEGSRPKRGRGKSRARALKYDPPLTPPASRRRACPRHRRACSQGCRSSAAPTGIPRDRNCDEPSRHTPRRALRSHRRQGRRSQSTAS